MCSILCQPQAHLAVSPQIAVFFEPEEATVCKQQFEGSTYLSHECYHTASHVSAISAYFRLLTDAFGEI